MSCTNLNMGPPEARIYLILQTDTMGNRYQMLVGVSGAAGASVHGCSFWPVRILFVEALVPVIQRRALALDEQVLHFGRQLERVAVGDDDVGDFAGLERADLIGYAENLRRIDRDCFQGFVVREAVGDGVRGLLAKGTG